ncbi:MAG: hypothetical protein L0Y58_22465 [Verrucomicrobia subdivision 3 bacterium]|nr:hypothetical protein [Limisphaerales bacterium]
MRKLTKFAGVALLVSGLASLSATAGEPIIGPTDKGKSSPAAEINKSAARDLFNLREKAPGPSPLDVLNVHVTIPRKPLDGREEKRERLRRLEKENWMVVGQGELQQEEEDKNFLGVRDYSLDDLEKDDAGNLMFRDLNKDDNKRMPGQFRSSVDGRRQLGQRQVSGQERQRTEDTDVRLRQDQEKNARVAPHIVSELNLGNAFDAKPSGGDSLSPKFNKSDLTLYELLNSDNTPDAAREQARREEFRNFLNNPTAASPLSGPSDPINFRGDLTRQPVNPTTPQPFGANAAPAATPFGSSPGLARPSSSPFSPGASSFAPARPATFGSDSFLTPPETARSKAPLTFDPPKRKF